MCAQRCLIMHEVTIKCTSQKRVYYVTKCIVRYLSAPHWETQRSARLVLNVLVPASWHHDPILHNIGSRGSPHLCNYAELLAQQPELCLTFSVKVCDLRKVCNNCLLHSKVCNNVIYCTLFGLSDWSDVMWPAIIIGKHSLWNSLWIHTIVGQCGLQGCGL